MPARSRLRSQSHARARRSDAGSSVKVHLLDVGQIKYGDCVLLELPGSTVLVDGAHTGDDHGTAGHDSIPAQIQKLLGGHPPFTVDLLVVTHAHEDHIGSLPAMVAAGTLRARSALVTDPGLGWGRAKGAPPPDAGEDRRVSLAVAGLREELRLDESDGRSAEEFLADAANLESRYKQMLQTLASQGTDVVRFVGPDDAKVKALARKFASVGLAVLGPSQEVLLRCADGLSKGQKDAVDAARRILGGDDRVDASEIYRRLASSELDAAADSRLGNLVNLQSIALEFDARGRKLLVAGDLQFAKPGTSDPKIRSGVLELRQAIAKRGPYDFVKLSHHGSDNAVDASFLKDLGSTQRYGICAGEHSTQHPNAAVLGLLKSHKPALQWVRTDRNRLSSFVFTGSKAVAEVETGKIDDPRPNSADEGPPGPTIAPPAGTSPSVPAGEVEVTARIPTEATRVRITVEIEPPAAGGGPRVSIVPSGRGDTIPRDLSIGGGRPFPRVLVVTSEEALARNVGREEASAVLGAVRAKGLPLVSDLPAGARALDAAKTVAQRTKSAGNLDGVLLLGGYDVVPSLRLDVLSPQLRRSVGDSDDPDDFVVWSDDIYAGDGGTVAQRPISRLPDARSAAFLFKALQAAGSRAGTGRCGVRNIRREFADGVFAALPGKGSLATSRPTTRAKCPPLDGDLVYLMLHGDDRDGSRFWGEDTDGGEEAVTVGNVPAASGPVVFTGCCWGALTSDPAASQSGDGQPIAPRAPESSIALKFLDAGAVAFVGCTGAHYSPTEKPYAYFGGPIHSAFWSAYLAGAPPARALFQAKRAYAAKIPHRSRTAISEAIERKILAEYTCVGLGF